MLEARSDHTTYQVIPQNTSAVVAPPTGYFYPDGGAIKAGLRICQFVNAADGAWVSPASDAIQGSPTTPIPIAFARWTYEKDETVSITGSFSAPADGNWMSGGYLNALNSTVSMETWSRQTENKQRAIYISWASQANTTALIVLAENSSSVVAATVPQNYSHPDLSFPGSDPVAFVDLGAGVIPIVADNTVEGNAAEVTYIDGTGGAGACEHVITTALANATLVVVPVDGDA